MTDDESEDYRRRVETIANVLIETFGDRALEVAQTQSKLAELEGFAVWDAVTHRLTTE